MMQRNLRKPPGNAQRNPAQKARQPFFPAPALEANTGQIQQKKQSFFSAPSANLIQRTIIEEVDPKADSSAMQLAYKYFTGDRAKVIEVLKKLPNPSYATIADFLEAVLTIDPSLEPQIDKSVVHRIKRDLQVEKADAQKVKPIKKPAFSETAIKHSYQGHTIEGITAAKRIVSKVKGENIAIFPRDIGKNEVEKVADALSTQDLEWESAGAGRFDAQVVHDGMTIKIQAQNIGGTMSVDSFFCLDHTITKTDAQALWK